jgi:TolB-like protein
VPEVADSDPEIQETASATLPPSFGRSGPRLRWILPGIVVLAGTAIAGWAVLRHSATPPLEVTLPRVPGRKALAVMYFENQSAKPDWNWLSEGLADMFITDLAHFDRLTVLSRQQLHLLLERSGHKPPDGIHLDLALDIARKSHAEGVLLGSFMTLGEKILINVRLFDTASGQLIDTDQFVVDQPADILTRVDLLTPRLGGGHDQ